MGVAYLDYTIHLSDKDQVATLQAAPSQLWQPVNTSSGGGGKFTGVDALDALALGIAPDQVGYIFAAPQRCVVPYGAPIIPRASAFSAPCITSDWITDIGQTNLPVTQDEIDRHHGGFFGFAADFFAGTTTFIWRGHFEYAPPQAITVTDGDVTVTPEAIKVRRWVDGFESPDQGENGSDSTFFTRAASRHADGFGFEIRGNAGVKNHAVAENGHAAAASSWERLYIRLKALPSGNVTFWRCKGSVSALSGIQLAIAPTGRILVYDTTATGATTFLAQTDPLVPFVWYRLDNVFVFGASAAFGLYLNGIAKLAVGAAGSTGLGIVQNHLSSEIGQNQGQASLGLGLDIDDWMCADHPADFNGNDWVNGSRMLRVEPQFLSDDTADWDGDIRCLLQNPIADGPDSLVSSTSGARLGVVVNAEQIIDAERNGLGAAAFVVGFYNKRAGTDEGTLGYNVAGTADVLNAIVSSTNARWNWAAYRPSGMITPAAITPLVLLHEKAASVDASHVYAFVATVELLGAFGPEDVTPSKTGKTPATFKGNTGIHNAPYPRTPWAKLGAAPISPVVIVGGSYTGNDVGQDIALRVPAHFVWIRHVASNGLGTVWFSSCVAAHRCTEQKWDPRGLVRAEIDPLFSEVIGGEDDQATQTILQLTGNVGAINQNGETYAYVAFCDPGMRFLLNGAIAYPYGTADRTTTLINSNFLAEALLLFREAILGSSNTELYYKGLGHAGQDVSKLVDTGVTGSALAIARGSLLSRSAIKLTNEQQSPFALFRRDDGSADPGIVDTIWIGSYVGDGSGNRTITVQAAATTYPLFALVVPHNATAIFRDHAHTGTISTTVPSSDNAATGIRGGDIGKIKVGSALNANGITYDVLVIPGGTSANADGFSDPGEFVPVTPATPKDGPWDTPPTTAPGDLPIPTIPTVPPPVEGDPLATGCVASTQGVMNIALLRCGITKKIDNLTTEDTIEADTARQIVSEGILRTLRAFPWPFATAYRTLALVAGDADTPANEDWQYAYTEPADCVYARRIVREGFRRRFDPYPPPFKTANDPVLGPVIYTNHPDALLEYTYTPACAVTAGDALFRDALAWMWASDLALPLCRDAARAKDALGAFGLAIKTAEGAALNESQRSTVEPDATWIRNRDNPTGAGWHRDRE